ncbi:MAG: hypothetical protein K0R02_194 [Rickettsiaceae bacterium]|jgi:hypothetical protein|nr:hypothetical protein [Rickettsiaceae bacterium]
MEIKNTTEFNKAICREKWLTLITKLADSIDMEIDRLNQDKTKDNSKAKAALCNAVTRIMPLVLKICVSEEQEEQTLTAEEDKMLYNYYMKYYKPDNNEEKSCK